MKIKKLIILLSLVCAVFFSFNLSASAAYGVGDSIEGIEITKVASIWDETFTYYFVTDEKVYLFNNDDTYFSVTGGMYTINYTDKYVSGTISDDNTVSLSGYGRNGGKFSNPISLSSVSASNFDIFDNNGSVVFPPPLQVVPGLEGITTELLLAVLTELKPIILGLIVLVVGFIAFRKAWNWVLTTFSHG